MSRRQRIALVVVFALVVGGFALAATGQRGGAADLTGGQGGVVGWLGRALGHRSTVSAADLAAGCPLARDRLAVDGTCRLTVKPHRGGVRTLHLRAVDEVAVTAPVPGQSVTATETVRADQELKVAVDEEGGDVTIACKAAAECAVLLVGGA